MTRARRPLLLALVVAATAACVNVLGLDKYTDAIRVLCDKCGDSLEDCEKRLNLKIVEATEEDRTEWLKLFGALKCDTPQCQTTAYQCFYGAPDNCSDATEPCVRAEECCDFDFEDPKEGGTCCRGDGDGACCAQCQKCGDAINDFLLKKLDLTKLCRSHEEAWNDLENCVADKCTTPCATGVGCGVCVDNNCKQPYNACKANDAP